MFGFFFKLFDLFAILFEIEYAESRRFFDGYVAHCDRAVGIVALVVFEHIVIIHLVDVVTAQNDDVIGVVIVDKLDVLINRVCGAFVPLARFCVHIRRKNVDAAAEPVKVPRLTVAYVLVQFKGTILRQHAYRIDAAVYAVGKRKIDDAIREGEVNNPVLSAEGHRGLCDARRQNAETRALSACKKHRYALFFGYFAHFLSSLYSGFKNITEFLGMLTLIEYG